MSHKFAVLGLTIVACLTPAFARAQSAVLGPPVWKVFSSTHPTPLFYAASGLAVGRGGSVFIADAGNHRVDKYTPSGALLSVWGTDTAGPLYFEGPRSIAVDPSGSMYVADRGVVKLTSFGRFVRRFSGGALDAASGLTAAGWDIFAISLHAVPSSPLYDRLTLTHLSPSGKVSTVRVFSYPDPPADALLSAAIGTTGSGDLVLSIAGQKHCHSCDGRYYQVWTLSQTGKILSQWSAPGGGISVSVDAAGTIAIADTGKIDFMSSAGEALPSFGVPGCGPGQFGNDLRVAYAPDGTLYASDSQPGPTLDDQLPAAMRAGVVHRLQPTTSPAGFDDSLRGTCPVVRPSDFGQIQGLAVARGGGLVVADESYGLVRFVSQTGQLQGSFPAGHPNFVAVGGSGNLYVPDLQLDMLTKRSPSGVTLARVEPAAFEDAVVDRAGYIYGITPFGQVQVLAPIAASALVERPHIVRQWTIRSYEGSVSGLSPSGIALDSAGNVYVTDTRSNRVQKFSSRGRFLRMWGTQGSKPGQFRTPIAIAISSHDRVFVLDRGNSRLQEFNVDGKLLGVFGRRGMAPGQLLYPAGIAVDSSGRVFVGDNGNDRIQELIGAK